MAKSKITDLTPGTTIVIDGNFSCIANGQERVVKADEFGAAYFDCTMGKHYLTIMRDAHNDIPGVTIKGEQDA